MHDVRYRNLKAKGASGWDGPEIVSEHKKELGFALSSPLFKQHSRALELGCGAGEITLWLSELGHDVVGVDLSPAAVEWAREKAAGKGLIVSFVQGNVCDLNAFKDNSFDVIIDSHCFHCIIGNDRDDSSRAPLGS